MRLIDADALMKAVEKDFEGVCVYDVTPNEAVSDFERIIDSMPTINAEPVRLRVEKVDIVETNGWYRKRFYCPCGQLIRTEAWDEKRCFGQGTILKENVMPHFCPNCGAKMDLEVQNDHT